MDEVVKVQIPMIGDRSRALIYCESEAPRPGETNSRGARVTHQALGREARKAMDGDFTAFFFARFEYGRWKLGQRTRDYRW